MILSVIASPPVADVAISQENKIASALLRNDIKKLLNLCKVMRKTSLRYLIKGKLLRYQTLLVLNQNKYRKRCGSGAGTRTPDTRIMIPPL